MPDADHVAIYGYFEQKINSLEMDLSDLPPNSSVSRSITIRGDEYAVFSLEIYSSAGTYYNFNDKTWVSYKTKLRRKRVNNTYTTSVKFPQASSVNYTVSLHAEIVENIKTTHVDFVDFRNADNSVNVNKTQGSNSNVLTRIIYQDALVAVRFGCVAPSLYATSNATVNGATSGSNCYKIAWSIDGGDYTTEVPFTVDNGENTFSINANGKTIQFRIVSIGGTDPNREISDISLIYRDKTIK